MNTTDPSLGAVGEDVRALHAILQQRRFYIPRQEASAGYFGPGTSQALALFQRNAALPVTGLIDRRTAEALGFSVSIEIVAGEQSPVCCGESVERPPPQPQPQVDAVNDACPWSGKPVHPEGVMVHQGRNVGFCSKSHRDKFARAIEHFDTQKDLPLESRSCPWSGRRVRPNATMVCDGQLVGFCSPEHRDQFKRAIEHFAAPSSAVVTGMTSMAPMEEVEDTIYVPPLVDDTVVGQFCQAAQICADTQNLHDVAARKIAELQLRLTNLRNLASLSRLALVGHPLSFERLEDEMHCLAEDFRCEKLVPEDDDCCADMPADLVFFSAAVDLFAGATFLCWHDLDRRDRLVSAIVKAIEAAIAFPVCNVAEAATFLGQGTIALSPAHAAAVISNATQRLIESDRACIPRLPKGIRRRLYGLACAWMNENPVTAFFAAIDAPRIHRIVRWQADDRRDNATATAVGPARVGDPVTLLLHKRTGHGCGPDPRLHDYGVMFTPRQPVTDGIVVEDGFQVRIPQQCRTGPVIVIPKAPDFTRVSQLLTEYQLLYPDEINGSVFVLARIDTWAWPIAARHPVIAIEAPPVTATATAFTASGALAAGQTVRVGDTVSIQYRTEPPTTSTGTLPSIDAPGGSILHTGRPDMVLFRPTAPGNTTVTLAWDKTSVSIPISVSSK